MATNKQMYNSSFEIKQFCSMNYPEYTLSLTIFYMVVDFHSLIIPLIWNDCVRICKKKKQSLSPEPLL